MVEKLEERYLLKQPVLLLDVGELWHASDKVDGRNVVVALLDPAAPGNESQREGFLGRARALAGVDHANVARVTDLGTTSDGTLFAVGDFVDGPSLTARWECEPAMTLGDLLDIAEQVLSGLEALHRRGVVHLDMEPSHIMLDQGPSGTIPRIVGFGLNRANQQSDAATPEARKVMLATLAHWAPEVIRGGVVDVRADIYGLGTVLYAGILGRPPFRGDTPEALADVIVAGDAPTLEALGASVSPALSAVVARAMAPAPEARFASAEAMAAALRHARQLDPPLASAQLPIGRRAVAVHSSIAPPPLPRQRPSDPPGPIPASTPTDRQPASRHSGSAPRVPQPVKVAPPPRVPPAPKPLPAFDLAANLGSRYPKKLKLQPDPDIRTIKPSEKLDLASLPKPTSDSPRGRWQQPLVMPGGTGRRGGSWLGLLVVLAGAVGVAGLLYVGIDDQLRARENDLPTPHGTTGRPASAPGADAEEQGPNPRTGTDEFAPTVRVTLGNVPRGARVLVNGQPVSRTALFLPRGREHTLTVIKLGYRTWTHRFVAQEDLFLPVEMRGEGEGSPAP